RRGVSPAHGPASPIGTPGCQDCDGTGFELVVDEQGVSRAWPCAACRPDHPANRAAHRQRAPRVAEQLDSAEVYAERGLRWIAKLRADHGWPNGASVTDLPVLRRVDDVLDYDEHPF